MKKYNGDWLKVIDHIKVRRLLLSEKDRIGIGTLNPSQKLHVEWNALVTGNAQIKGDTVINGNTHIDGNLKAILGIVPTIVVPKLWVKNI